MKVEMVLDKVLRMLREVIKSLSKVTSMVMLKLQTIPRIWRLYVQGLFAWTLEWNKVVFEI